MDPRRAVPSTDRLLAEPRIAAAGRQFRREIVKAAVHAAQREARAGGGAVDPERVVAGVLARLPGGATTLRPVLNATGVVVHTNLGRAPLGPAALAAVTAAAGYCDVEFDLDTGRRARRGRGAGDALRAAVPAAGDVHIVNNGAAALVLAAVALTRPDRREVAVSRGELVEIGDGFRLPELLAAAGVRLVEVGTTNRTTLGDYTAAVGPATAFVLKVHPSNFTMRGFTASAPVAELAGLRHEGTRLPVVVDVGSGLLRPDPLLPEEPDVSGVLAAGAALVTGSGDKLFGGPQAGLIFGRAELVDRVRRHPLARAFRVDKLTLAAVEATASGPAAPTALALHADPGALRSRAAALVDRLAAAGVPADLVPSPGVAGGGGAPGVELPGWAAGVDPGLARPLRLGRPAVVGRVRGGRLLLDPRCVPAERDAELAAAVVAAAGAQAQPDAGSSYSQPPG
jgi:L-seryl-tRNA(Ser) seleniumtransferase